MSGMPISTEWRMYRMVEYRVPEKAELDLLLETVDYRKIVLEGQAAALPGGMAVDLGSVAKGWAGDRLAALLREKGVQSALLDLGGNIQTLGRKPDGSFVNVENRLQMLVMNIRSALAE